MCIFHRPGLRWGMSAAASVVPPPLEGEAVDADPLAAELAAALFAGFWQAERESAASAAVTTKTVRI